MYTQALKQRFSTTGSRVQKRESVRWGRQPGQTRGQKGYASILDYASSPFPIPLSPTSPFPFNSQPQPVRHRIHSRNKTSPPPARINYLTLRYRGSPRHRFQEASSMVCYIGYSAVKYPFADLRFFPPLPTSTYCSEER